MGSEEVLRLLPTMSEVSRAIANSDRAEAERLLLEAGVEPPVVEKYLSWEFARSRPPLPGPAR